MAVLHDRQAIRAHLRDHARWVIIVMVAGLVPLGLGAVLLVRESDRAARASQDARLWAVASGEGAALTESFARARALIGVTANSPVWREIVDVPGPLRSAVVADGQPLRRVQAALIALRAGYGPRAGRRTPSTRTGGSSRWCSRAGPSRGRSSPRTSAAPRSSCRR
jgi:hypothetical protein